MRICLLSMEYPPYPSYISAGGVGTHTCYLSKFLARRGHEVHVITCGDHQFSEVIDGVHVHRIRSLPSQALRLPFYSISASKRLHALNEFIKFDIVHNQSPYGFFEAYLSFFSKPIPLVTTIHAVPSRELMALQYDPKVGVNDLREKLSLIIPKILFNKVEYSESNKIIAVSNFVKRDLVKFHSIPEEKIAVVHNGVDVERFKPDLAENKIKSLLELQDSKMILYVGRLIKRKGPGLLIQCASKIIKRYPAACFVIVGTGYFEEELKKTAKKLNQQIVFANRVSDNLLPLYYAAADIVALPSLYEGAPLTLLEAMASAKPIVTTNIPPITELVNNHTAVTINPGDMELFVEKITELLLNEEYRRALGSKARSKVLECFTWEKVAEETEKVYKEVIN